jgi:mTERF
MGMYGNFLGRGLDALRQILQFIEELGIPRESRMFLVSFRVLGAYNKDKLVRSVASQPLLLGYSLEKRLVPRHNVLSILAAKGLKKKLTLLSVCFFTERRFLEKFVESYKKDVPELAAAARNTSV